MSIRHRLLSPVKGNKGFSLAELIIALTLIAVLTAIAVPNFKAALPNYRLKSASRDLYSIMQQAKMNAVMERRVWGVKFDAGSGSYRVCAENGDNPAWAAAADTDLACLAPVSLAEYRSGIGYGFGVAVQDVDGDPVDPAETITYDNEVILFTVRGMATGFDAGSPTGDGDGYVYLTNDRGDAYAVGSRTTGAIMVRRWNAADSEWQ